MPTPAPCFDALILAGSRKGADPMAEIEGYRHKALIEIAGSSMLARVVSALREAGAQRILVSCCHPDVAEHALALGAEVVEPADGPSASILKAMGSIDRPMIVTTADHALLRSEWVSQLISNSPDTADFAIMIAHSDAIEAAMPASRRTYFKFADGRWSGCNLFLLRTPDARRAIELWRGVEADRKKPWKAIARLGARNLIDYLSGRLTAAEGIGRLGRRIGIEAGMVSAQDGLAAVDVDTLTDLASVLKVIAKTPSACVPNEA